MVGSVRSDQRQLCSCCSAYTMHSMGSSAELTCTECGTVKDPETVESWDSVYKAMIAIEREGRMSGRFFAVRST